MLKCMCRSRKCITYAKRGVYACRFPEAAITVPIPSFGFVNLIIIRFLVVVFGG